ncbi:MAG TPA: ABC transporter substrate-binding protein, partial [Xanthobacteraceae bacterium]|nr:ABC transporter substrate-binding protein [Xanthobacteraceae bacterium]
MAQRLWLTLSALAVAAALAAPGPAAAQQKDVEIAMIVPLSGPWARQGVLERMGAEMAIDDINKAGGIKALGGAKLKLVVLDTGDSPEKAKNAAQRLVSQNPEVIGGFGAWLSSFTLAVTEVTERAELPWLTLSYADAITGRGFHYVFQTSATADRQSEMALPTIMDLAEKSTGKRPTTTGVLQDNTAAPVSFMKPMRGGGFEKAGLKVVVDEVYTPPLSDATPLVAKVRTAHPDFLWVISTNIPDDSLLMQKLTEMGVGPNKLPAVGNGAHFGAPELLKVAGADVLEGMLITVANWSNDGQRELIDRFRKRTGEPWLTQDSLCAYGHVWILKEAVEKAGVADKHKVAEAIRAMDTSEGPAKFFAGNHIKFDDKGRRVDAPLVIFQWQNGVPVTVYPQGPGT